MADEVEDFQRHRDESLVKLVKNEVIHPTERLAISYIAWGRLVSNGELLDQFAHVPKVEQIIGDTRIVERHHPEMQRFVTEEREALAEETIAVGTRVARQTLKKNRWDGFDVIIVSSSLPPDSRGAWGEEIARRLGNSGAEVRFAYLACGGAGVAFHDILQEAEEDKELAKARVGIIAVEPLGWMLNGADRSLEALTLRGIFGNGAVAMAFSPQDFELYGGKTVIVPDREGVIRVPHTYDLVGERVTPPEWYEVEGVTEEEFAYTQRGVALKLAEPKRYPNFAEMSGAETAILFKQVVPPVVVAVLKTVKEEYGIEVDLGVFHQPSGVPFRHIDLRALRQKMLPAAGLRQMRIPWVLDVVGMGNSSSATTLVALAEMFRRGEIGREAFNVTSFGIGMAIMSMVVRFKGWDG